MGRTARGLAVWLAAAGLGAAGTVLLLPWLKQVDPLGITPVALIAFLGGTAFGWYVRGTGREPTPAEPR